LLCPIGNRDERAHRLYDRPRSFPASSHVLEGQPMDLLSSFGLFFRGHRIDIDHQLFVFDTAIGDV
jgi:hypothetical protein